MKIASFNVNGIRARMPIILYWLEQHRPDALCLQETKVQDPDFPLKPLADIGYQAAFKGQKAYNGVAILSRRTSRLQRATNALVGCSVAIWFVVMLFRISNLYIRKEA